MKLQAGRAFGLLLVADGAAALVRPRKYLRSLETGTPLIDDIFDYFSHKPEVTRGVSVLEVTLGFWLLLR